MQSNVFSDMYFSLLLLGCNVYFVCKNRSEPQSPFLKHKRSYESDRINSRIENNEINVNSILVGINKKGWKYTRASASV